ADDYERPRYRPPRRLRRARGRRRRARPDDDLRRAGRLDRWLRRPLGGDPAGARERPRPGLHRTLYRLGWPVDERLADLPVVSEGIFDPSQEPAVALFDGSDLRGAKGDGAFDDRVRILD